MTLSRSALVLTALMLSPPAIHATARPAAAQTLQEALALAYSNNPTLQSARAQLRAVDENVPQALAGWRPTVQVTGSFGQSTQSVVGAALPGNNAQTRTPWRSRDTVSTQAAVTQPI